MNDFELLKNEDNTDINERNRNKKIEETKRLLEKLNNGEKLNNDQLNKIIKYKDFIEDDEKDDKEDDKKDEQKQQQPQQQPQPQQPQQPPQLQPEQPPQLQSQQPPQPPQLQSQQPQQPPQPQQQQNLPNPPMPQSGGGKYNNTIKNLIRKNRELYSRVQYLERQLYLSNEHR